MKPPPYKSVEYDREKQRNKRSYLASFARIPYVKSAAWQERERGCMLNARACMTKIDGLVGEATKLLLASERNLFPMYT
jgi:hypothetical protein